MSVAFHEPRGQRDNVGRILGRLLGGKETFDKVFLRLSCISCGAVRGFEAEIAKQVKGARRLEHADGRDNVNEATCPAQVDDHVYRELQRYVPEHSELMVANLHIKDEEDAAGARLTFLAFLPDMNAWERPAHEALTGFFSTPDKRKTQEALNALQHACGSICAVIGALPNQVSYPCNSAFVRGNFNSVQTFATNEHHSKP